MPYATKSASRRVFAKVGSVVVATAVIVAMGGGVSKAANSKKYKATCAGSYTGDPNLSYDGVANLGVGHLYGHDNIEGDFVAQDYVESGLTAVGTCTAPDGTAGHQLPDRARRQPDQYL